jgi:hypothetical protein
MNGKTILSVAAVALIGALLGVAYAGYKAGQSGS